MQKLLHRPGTEPPPASRTALKVRGELEKGLALFPFSLKKIGNTVVLVAGNGYNSRRLGREAVAS